MPQDFLHPKCADIHCTEHFALARSKLGLTVKRCRCEGGLSRTDGLDSMRCHLCRAPDEVIAGRSSLAHKSFTLKELLGKEKLEIISNPIKKHEVCTSINCEDHRDGSGICLSGHPMTRNGTCHNCVSFIEAFLALAGVTDLNPSVPVDEAVAQAEWSNRICMRIMVDEFPVQASRVQNKTGNLAVRWSVTKVRSPTTVWGRVRRLVKVYTDLSSQTFEIVRPVQHSGNLDALLDGVSISYRDLIERFRDFKGLGTTPLSARAGRCLHKLPFYDSGLDRWFIWVPEKRLSNFVGEEVRHRLAGGRLEFTSSDCMLGLDRLKHYSRVNEERGVASRILQAKDILPGMMPLDDEQVTGSEDLPLVPDFAGFKLLTAPVVGMTPEFLQLATKMKPATRAAFLSGEGFTSSPAAIQVKLGASLSEGYKTIVAGVHEHQLSTLRIPGSNKKSTVLRNLAAMGLDRPYPDSEVLRTFAFTVSLVLRPSKRPYIDEERKIALELMEHMEPGLKRELCQYWEIRTI